MAALRPEHSRTLSTNLHSGSSYRPFDGKLAILTGASRGIGLAIAQILASKGCSLILNYTSPKSTIPTEELAKTLQSEHHISTLPVQADVGTLGGAAHIVATAKNHFSHPKTGKFQIDMLINNAGVCKSESIEELTPETWEWIYRINVLGPALLMKEVMPYLPHDRTGRVINVSSVSASEGFQSQTFYGGSKAALDAMSRTWARELANRATVNSINPGPVGTDMWYGNSPEYRNTVLKPFVQHTPGSQIRPDVDDKAYVDDADNAGGRPGYPHEIAGIVAMLCSDDAVWCTGQVVCANGGLRMSM